MLPRRAPQPLPAAPVAREALQTPAACASPRATTPLGRACWPLLGACLALGGCCLPSGRAADPPPPPTTEPVLPASEDAPQVDLLAGSNDPIQRALDVTPCVKLHWSGGSADDGEQEVEAQVEKLDAGDQLKIQYAWRGGVLELRRQGDSRRYTGSWTQEGESHGRAALDFETPFTQATGHWTAGGDKTRHPMRVTPCP